MEQQRPLSGDATNASTQSVLGLNDQACNECRRRKGRCDRQLPECGPCARNKRHCLYETNSRVRSPLTRKYLTTIEERLRQAEARARQAERRAQIAEANQSRTAVPANGTSEGARSASIASAPTSMPDLREREVVASANVIDLGGLRAFNETPHTDWLDDSQDPESGLHWLDSGEFVGPDLALQAHDLEAPPSETDDFSWDEHSLSERSENRNATGASAADEEAGVTDGMASLSVEDRSGYLGVASGAAMLRLLLPDAEHRRPIRQALHTRLRSLGGSHMAETQDEGWVPTPVWAARRIGEIDLDAAISSYFSLYHLSYPLVHEPTFRAQYAQVIQRPSGRSWNALAYMVAAIGLFTASKEPVTRDLDLFEAAKANISIDSLETGNLTLVQVLILMSNYLQKRNKPNSGYNYLGLALHMAMGLGLHKEFHNWRIAPLAMEIRRRVWSCLHVFAVGAMVTFGRPLSWPMHGIEVSLPLNVDDRDLTNVSVGLPSAKAGITTYSAVTAQARFHLATHDIYSKVISVNFPGAAELLRLDDQFIEPWRLQWHGDGQPVPPKYRLSRVMMEWRYRNFRIIMFRPFVIRQVLLARTRAVHVPADGAIQMAIDRCLHEARASIASIHEFWTTSEHQSVMAAWYGLYFLFQASLIPCVCLRNDPASNMAQGWRDQIRQVIEVLQSMRTLNPASVECHQVILRLCGDFLTETTTSGSVLDNLNMPPVEESPQTQLSGVYSMMWPSANQADVDIFMPEHGWENFFSEAQSEVHTTGTDQFTDSLPWD